MSKTPPLQSSGKTLDILNLLLRHFAHGLTNIDIARATGLDAPGVVRHVNTLVDKGFAERIPETGRIRPSVKLAQASYGILKSLDDAANRVDELKSRITRT